MELSSQPSLSFENLSPGTYFASFLSANLGFSGIQIGNNIADIDGCFDFATPIEIVLEQASITGGLLSTDDGSVAVDLCFDSMITQQSVDVILTDTIGVNFAWVITDDTGVILDLPLGPPFIFDDQDSTICEIRNLSFDSTLVGLNLGMNIDTLMSNGDFVFSNPVVVNKSIVNGGTLTTAAGTLTDEVCIGDGGIPDQLFLSLTGAVAEEETFVVTGLDSVITEIINGGTTAITVEGFVGDTCLIFNLSASAEVLGLTIGNNLNQLAGCMELSNPVTLIKTNVDAGVLSIVGVPDNIIDFCVSDGLPDSLIVNNSSTVGSFQLVVTDANDVITQIAVSDTFDFEGSAFGQCRIYGVSFTGNFIAMIGDVLTQVPLSDDCYVFTSVPVTVNKLDCSQPIINEVYDDERVEIINIGTAPVDLSTWFLCSNTVYEQIGSLATSCGDNILDPGELVVVELATIDVDNLDDEMGLYIDSGFGQSSSIRSYVEWGSTGHFRSGIAAIADVWTAGEFAAPFAQGSTLNYDGDGILGSDWTEGAASECTATLVPQEEPVVSRRINVQMYPNPAKQFITINVETLPADEGIIVVYDSFGKIVMKKLISAGETYDLDLSTLDPGVYQAKVNSGRAGIVSRFVVIE